MGPWVTRLIVANVLMFLVAGPGTTLYRLLAFVPGYVLAEPWRVYTIFTYMFLHADLFHILFNMLMLFFFGTRLEHRLGGNHFVVLYVVSGITGALLSFVFSPGAAIVGASGAVFGVALGFARFWPDEPVYIWGILPVPAKILVFGMTAISIFSGFTGTGGNVAHFAHLGGFLGGWIYLKWWEKRRRGGWNPSPTPAARPRTSASQARDATRRWESIRREELHELNRAEVDRILEKLKEKGYDSLTTSEREYLDRMSTP